ncbi:hypothetical protein T440DRAFT_399665 [Plenodomus tracheiphilus IPT5]|uniref:Pathway-specific nitrogen regulator n=1 Tax=Plenodomus tracheiphilus IPT5 TaxID=1408161 RepID=A0A6A7B150_9PLEO|nr:hypothetical protein T440DRAFT_399665 [Plenodomus tracheiphilus IPT5]
MTTLHQSAPQGLTSFAIYEDRADLGPLSPSPMYEGGMSFNSEAADEAMPSVEFEAGLSDEPEPYRSSYTSRNSISDPRRSSGATHYSLISAIPSESSMSSNPNAHSSQANDVRYTPRKDRPRFRNPESVRAMQMSSPPPLPAAEASRERMKTYKPATPSRTARSETPVSRRSGSRRESIREQHSPRPIVTPQQAPLVLLHVTILPMQMPYPHDVMARVMPEWLVENYKVLEEKLQDIILMRRGLLIPHPRDEYDLLEERILESLELKTPRILKCGHFVPPEDDSDKEEEDDAASLPDDATGRGSRMSGGTLTSERNMHSMDDGTCTDCHRELKKPGKGVGAGSRKFDIKVYAANGLMRAAAWGACWGDMERCDVEISPWMPEEVRKGLEKKVLEEQEASKRKQLYAVELQRQIQEAAAKQKAIEDESCSKKKQEEEELQKSFEAAAAALQRSIDEKAAEKKKFEEVLETKIEEAKESVRLELETKAIAEHDAVAERLRALEAVLKEKKKAESELMQKGRKLSVSGRARASDFPLSTLLKNYVRVLLGDRRNLVILGLSAAVVFLAMNVKTSGSQQIVSPQLTSVPNAHVSSAIVTTTAISIATFTVTEIQISSVMQATSLPTPEVMAPVLEVEEISTPIEELELSDAALVIEEVVNAPDSSVEETTAEEEAGDSNDETLVEDVVEPIAMEASTESKANLEAPISAADFCIIEPIFQTPITFCAVDEQ